METLNGTRGRTRTGTAFIQPTDFKSVVSTNSTTQATIIKISKN